MGRAFDKWLAKPSTIHFLRRLVAVPTPAETGSTRFERRFDNCSVQNRRHVSTIRRPPNGQSESESLHPSRNGTHNDPAEVGLRMSIRSGVPFLDKEVEWQGSFGTLRFEADVNSDTKLGKLLVDQPEYMHNAKMWVEILHFRQRLDGLDGVLDVWHGMRRRGVELPVSGEEADLLWTGFVQAGMRPEGGDERGWILSKIVAYAIDLKQRTGSCYENLYKAIVGRALRARPKLAVDWHKRLVGADLAPSDAVATVAIDAMLSHSSIRAWHQFKSIYKNSPSRDLYDRCMAEAIKLEDETLALDFHRLFLQNGDGPSTEMFRSPAIQRVFELDNDESLPMITPSQDRAKRAQTIDKQTLKDLCPPLTRESMNMIVGNVHGIKPKEISDTFCARMFATRAFSLPLVMRGLSFFAVDKLGPLAMREMAIRAGSLVEFSNKLRDLKTFGIAIGTSTFSKVALKLSNEGQSELWTVLLESDQHPEVYDEPATQKALLKSFLEQQQWRQAHLALLALSSSGSDASIEGWNLVLQHYLNTYQYRPMLNTLEDMRKQNLPLDRQTIRHLHDYLLPVRRPGKRRIKGQGTKFFDSLDCVIKAFMYASRHGDVVPHSMWVELLKRKGMEHHWDELERLVVWLAHYYSPRRYIRRFGLRPHSYVARVRLKRSMKVLPFIFSPNMRKALFTWGFRSASIQDLLRPVRNISIASGETRKGHLVEDQPSPEEWAKGLSLLKRFDQSSPGFPIDDVRLAFHQRMWILFGPAYSTIKVNNEARRLNCFSLAHYIRHANEVWPELVNWVDSDLLKNENEHDPRLVIQFFGRLQRVSHWRGEYVDVAAWANRAALSNNRYLTEPRRVPAKQRAWESSGLRITTPVLVGRARRHRLRSDKLNLTFLQERQQPSAR